MLQACDDVTTIDFCDKSNQLSDDELGIGTSTRLLLCGELEDDIVGTRKEDHFFERVRTFYETAVSKILAKFPFGDDSLKELAFLDPQIVTKLQQLAWLHWRIVLHHSLLMKLMNWLWSSVTIEQCLMKSFQLWLHLKMHIWTIFGLL